MLNKNIIPDVNEPDTNPPIETPKKGSSIEIFEEKPVKKEEEDKDGVKHNDYDEPLDILHNIDISSDLTLDQITMNIINVVIITTVYFSVTGLIISCVFGMTILSATVSLAVNPPFCFQENLNTTVACYYDSNENFSISLFSKYVSDSSAIFILGELVVLLFFSSLFMLITIGVCVYIKLRKKFMRKKRIMDGKGHKYNTLQ